MDLSTFPQAFRRLLTETMAYGSVEVNERTGVEIRALEGGHSFKLNLADGRLPVIGCRKLFPYVAAAEVAWFMTGSKSPAFLREHDVKIWDKFVEPDGLVDAAYGYRWRFAFDRDQVALAAMALATNPTDRRVWVQAWDPRVDGLGASGQRNVPCPIGFTFSIVTSPDGMKRLQSSLFIRSSDVFVGLPYDVMGHAMLMEVVAETVRQLRGEPIGTGTMHVTLAHPHIYSKHYDMAREALEQDLVTRGPLMYRASIDDVRYWPSSFVKRYREAAKTVPWPEFNPRPEIVV